MTRLTGGCHCGNIRLEIDLIRTPGAYSPRACDCDFCRKHGASYVSDPDGSLTVRVQEEGRLVRYRQGSGTAVCLVCANCGVVVGVVYDEAGKTFGAIN